MASPVAPLYPLPPPFFLSFSRHVLFIRLGRIRGYPCQEGGCKNSSFMRSLFFFPLIPLPFKIKIGNGAKNYLSSSTISPFFCFLSAPALPFFSLSLGPTSTVNSMNQIRPPILPFLTVDGPVSSPFLDVSAEKRMLPVQLSLPPRLVEGGTPLFFFFFLLPEVGRLHSKGSNSFLCEGVPSLRVFGTVHLPLFFHVLVDLRFRPTKSGIRFVCFGFLLFSPPFLQETVGVRGDFLPPKD